MSDDPASAKLRSAASVDTWSLVAELSSRGVTSRLGNSFTDEEALNILKTSLNSLCRKEILMTVPDPTTTSLPTTPTTHLEGIDGATLTWLVVALFLAAGLVVIFGRSVLDGGANARKRSSASSLIRSWAAISFVGGLLILGAASFGIGDETVRSTLLGGIVASTGAVVAFYFSGKHAEQARQDMMDAAFGTVTVPNLRWETIG